MANPSASKRRTNVSIDSALLDAARELGLNVSAISEAALAETVRAARGAAWKAENAAALAERRAWIARNGPPLARWQAWKPGT